MRRKKRKILEKDDGKERNQKQRVREKVKNRDYVVRMSFIESK